MAIQKKGGGLTAYERRVVKTLLSKDWRNQDIQALINIGRKTTVNSARITEVKKNPEIKCVSDERVEFYIRKQQSYDPRTGLNLYDDERLIRSREAMMLAVQVFNSPSLMFKTEIFAVLANIAWTYLLHEYCLRNKISIERDGETVTLFYMINNGDIPLSNGIKKNLLALKEIRDEVEHKLFSRSDPKWQSIFQACCLNFDKTLVEFFGEKVSLQAELSTALQFSKLNITQIEVLQQFDIPENIDALDKRLEMELSEEEQEDLEYRFCVSYTLTSASKGQSHMQFLTPESTDGKKMHNILVKHKQTDALYPYKAKIVCNKVKEETGYNFTLHQHTNAWKFFKIRPATNSDKPEVTNKRHCIYHKAHKDYTYSQNWVDYLINVVRDEEVFAAVKSYGKNS